MVDVTGIFSDLDGIVDESLESDDIATSLMNAYLGFSNELRERTGTAAGFTSLSEYFFFQAVRRYLERKLKISFKLSNETGDAKWLIAEAASGSIVLAHDLSVGRVLKNKSRVRPDIAVYRKSASGVMEVIALFYIKIYVSAPAVAEDEIKKLKTIMNKNSQVYFIFILPPIGEALDHYLLFLSSHPQSGVILGDINRFPPSHTHYKKDSSLCKYEKPFKKALDDIIERVGGKI